MRLCGCAVSVARNANHPFKILPTFSLQFHTVPMIPIHFENQEEFRKWLEKNHEAETELLVGFYKVDSGIPSMTWSQSVDQALCFGWIDGIRRSIDKERYCIRFTPRRPASIWSKINIDKVGELTKNGLMYPAGLAAFNNRKPAKSGIYSFENEPGKLADTLEAVFKENKSAWDFFKRQAPSYQKMLTYWIMSAKQETTRLTRLERLIKESEKQSRIRFM
jgi:uncharacterized protein YdeI (YjbR/CyaY-like superfamily)